MMRRLVAGDKEIPQESYGTYSGKSLTEQDRDLQLIPALQMVGENVEHSISRWPFKSTSRLCSRRKSVPKSGRLTSAITSLTLYTLPPKYSDAIEEPFA